MDTTLSEEDLAFQQQVREFLAEAWDEDTRKDRGKRAGKYWTGYHGDYIYTFVGGLSK